MDKSIYDKIRHYNKNATESSINLYTRNIILTAKALGYKLEEIKPEIFKDIKKVMEVLKEQSIYTQSNKIVAIYMYLNAMNYNKDVIQDYNDKMYLLSGKGKAASSTMKWTEKEKDKLISYDEMMILINKLRDELPKDINTFKTLDQMMQYLIIKFYVNYPIRGDIADLQIYTSAEFNNIKQDDDINYMVINPKNMDCKIILNNFKTKKEGVITFNITDDDFIEMIYKYYLDCKKYYQDNDRDYNHWFVFKKNYEKFTRNYLTKYIINIFNDNLNRKVGINMIRKITTSNMVNPKLKEMSRIQGHSLQTAITNYTKF